ncbi:helix-turn-helix domain-containing protein [Pseudonocardia nigra]|uniref:helix-turn-helix domain-containing protein n=1 Tax=Pseudonocardia nigra TaxID=1921578 RepID=UPI001C6021E8
MNDPLQDRQVRRRLAVLRHAEEVTGNVAQTCRYYGISRQCYYTWLRRLERVPWIMGRGRGARS